MSSDPSSVDRVVEQENSTSGRDRPKKPAPPRSPIERAVVWGLIAVLLVIVAWEFTAHLGYTKALRGLQERIPKVDEGVPFPMTDVPPIMGGKTPTSQDEINDPDFGRSLRTVYEWNGPIRKRAIFLMLTPESESHVIGFRTKGDVESPAPIPDE
ncbi:MAG: hypothetical protein O2955_10195 [Planctomycetota bacterium]|nr:hypothetical protein [Planctomycetota bacterium]MDA1212881.1 hypothetical protein [Planctomycetota bacterium]